MNDTCLHAVEANISCKLFLRPHAHNTISLLFLGMILMLDDLIQKLNITNRKASDVCICTFSILIFPKFCILNINLPFVTLINPEWVC